jgi:hypothetical protein
MSSCGCHTSETYKLSLQRESCSSGSTVRRLKHRAKSEGGLQFEALVHMSFTPAHCILNSTHDSIH